MKHIRLLRCRSVRVLWLSMTLSVLGDRLYGLAAMWVVYEATGSSSRTGLVAVVESLPYIALGGAGSVMARFSRWRSLAWVDAGRAVVALAVPLFWSPDTTGFLITLTLVLLLGTLSALFDPNFGALVPQLVPVEELPLVSGLFDLTSRIAGVLGQGSVGVLLLLVSEIELFAVDGCTFVVSALALGWLGHRTATEGSADDAPGDPPAAGRQGPDVRARSLLHRHPRIAIAVAVHGVALFTAAVSTVGLPPLLVSRFGQGATGYGLALAATAAGGLAGNLLTGQLVGRPADGGPAAPAESWITTYCLAWALSGFALAGLGVADSMTAVIALCVVSGLLFPVCAVTLRAHLTRFAPAERLRLLTVDQTVTRSAGMAGLLLLPPVVDAAPAGAFVGAGVLLSAAALTGWWRGGRTADASAGGRAP
ncbi:MFS transporter [Streptomyces hesseae]|uniref:MFS transporter n=1 Tax=Streptomyces hesseae TaxID=3075519 RepID=A0ABU2SUA3_9ACTN|nr:MFS transporter [Streptomyces sp. DSM 40473]MDT0451499.1 MFS transporter [Streptomyces sp. DSM 40473]